MPIYGVQDAHVKHDRSGVLYRIADQHFILTAAHGLLGAVAQTIPLYVPQGDPDLPPFPLYDAVFHATEVEGGRDVAAIRLSDEVAAKFGPSKEFLTHSRIGRTDDGRGMYVVFGYPMKWTGMVPRRVVSRPLVYLSRRYEGELRPGTFHDANVHMVLEFDQNAVDAFSGNDEQLPSIRGISGCGIWRVADWNSIDRWSPMGLRLVGLQNLWIKDADRRYVQGTRIGYVLQLILDNYPSLRNAMNLVYPQDHVL